MPWSMVKSLLVLYPPDVFHSEQSPLGKRSCCSCTPSRVYALTLNSCMLHAAPHSQASLLVVTALSGMLPVAVAPVLVCESSWSTCSCSQETPGQLHFLCSCPSMNDSQVYLYLWVRCHGHFYFQVRLICASEIPCVSL